MRVFANRKFLNKGWKTVAPNIDLSLYNEIACGNGICVAVGHDGRVAYSSDLKHWTEKVVKRPPAVFEGDELVPVTEVDLKSITYIVSHDPEGVLPSSGRFVVVGRNGNYGYYSVFDDLTEDIIIKPSDTTSPLNKVVSKENSGVGIVYAFSDRGFYVINPVDDTCTHIQEVQFDNNVTSVTSAAIGDNESCVCINGGDAYFIYKNNNQYRQVKIISIPYAECVVYDNDKFTILAQNNAIWTSLDGGFYWTRICDIRIRNYYFEKIIFIKNLYILLQYNTDVIVIFKDENNFYTQNTQNLELSSSCKLAVDNNRLISISIDNKVAYKDF